MRHAAALAASLLLAFPAQAAPDARLLQAAAAARPAELALLEKIVNIDSGTGDAAGAARVMAVLRPELEAIGATVEIVPAEAEGMGDNLVARIAGKAQSGKGRPGQRGGRILLIAHIDTVFPAGTAAQRPFRTDATRAYGPGVADEKGGVVTAIAALRLLHELGQTDFASITLLIETSEEVGSPGTRRLIDRLVRTADVELNMEPGDAPDAITVWRKGSSTIRLTVHGRAAHAGVDPQNGRNAAVELIHQLETVGRFPQTGDGITVNLTTLAAGERPNVIPDTATADVNYRVRTNDQFAQVLSAFEASAKHPLLPGATVEVKATPAFPPLPTNPATARLGARAQAIYAELGRTLALAGNGGASESALAAAAGTPALDGLGPVGGGFHSVREYLELASLTPRLYLVARLIRELGANPPAR